MKPLDFVRTPKGAIAIVTETNRNGADAAITFLEGCGGTGEKNAWWHASEGLVLIDSMPRLLARCMAHPFGEGKADVDGAFPI